jgi:hypothetical protein
MIYSLLPKPVLHYILLFILVLGVSLKTTAQKYKIGERVELNIDAKGIWYKGFVKDAQGFQYNNGYYLVRLDNAIDATGSIEFTVGTSSYNLMRAEGTKGSSPAYNCSFGPPPGTFDKSSPASIALFKRIVYNKRSNAATGAGGNPNSIGLSFLSFNLAISYKNTVSIKPGRGAVRLNEYAPANATIYPATVKFIVCEDNNPGVSRKEIETKYEFFVDRFGEWNASQPWYMDKTTVLE